MQVSYKEALEKLFQATQEINSSQNKNIRPLLNSIGFVLAEDIYCTRDLPAYNNSALDGYAIKYDDCGKKLKIKEKVLFAGVTTKEILKNGECFKIMTGAKIPDGADTILRFEDTKEINGYVLVPTTIKKGDAFRVKGEECKIGSLLIKKGTKLSTSHITMLSSQGISYVSVYAKIKVLVFSTGNELKEPYELANEDEFYNINSYSIISLLSSFGIKADYGGIIKDDLEVVKKSFHDAKFYDVVLTSGGVSAGEADFIKEALNANGFEPIFTSVKIKPGKPTVAGFMDKTLVVSLPGNPLAAFFNTFALVIPAIKNLNANNSPFHVKIKTKNKKEFRLKDGRTNIVLGFYKNGEFLVTDNGKISSGMVEPLLRSNALAIFDENVNIVSLHEQIDIYLLNN